MKYFTTSNFIKSNRNPNFIISVGNCQADNLLCYQKARAYNSGVYGWNYDVYEIKDFIIITGYRPIGKKCDYDTLKKLDNKAEKIIYSWTDDDEKEKLVNALLDEWVQTLREGL